MIDLLLSNPVAFELFGNPIYWYGIILVTAMLTSLVVGIWDSQRKGINLDIILEMFIYGIPIAIIGARIVYVLAHPADYFPLTKEVFMINHGGLTIIGGILGALIAAAIVSKNRKINILDMLDFGMPFLLLGQALGRWGNYVNQEAYGGIVSSKFFEQFPLGVYIDNLGTWHYATFFYEMVLNIIGFLLIYNIVKNTNKRGVGTICYFIWYGIVRGILEFTRMDAVVTNSGFPVTQFFSFLASGIGIIIVFLIYKGKLSFGYSRRMLTTRETDPTYSNFELNRKDFTKKTVALPKEPVPAKNNKNKGK